MIRFAGGAVIGAATATVALFIWATYETHYKTLRKGYRNE